MRSLAIYLTATYICYYLGLLAIVCVISGPVVAAVGVPDIAVLPVSLFASFALCGVVVSLAWRDQVEALQSFGVSLRNVAEPLAGACLGSQALFDLGILVAARAGLNGMGYTIISMISVFVAFVVVITCTWRNGDRGVYKACLLGLGIQSIIIASALVLVSKAGVWAAVALATIVGAGTLVYLGTICDPSRPRGRICWRR